MRIEQRPDAADAPSTLHEESTSASMLAPAQRASFASSSFEWSGRGDELLSDRQRHASSKLKTAYDKKAKGCYALPGVYFSPVLVRAFFKTSLCRLEYSAKVEWRVNPPELVDIRLTVAKLYEQEKMGDILLRITNNSQEEVELTLAAMKLGNETTMVFESIFFTLGKFEAGQTKDLYLRVRVLREKVDEDVMLKVIDMASGTKIEFIARINISF